MPTRTDGFRLPTLRQHVQVLRGHGSLGPCIPFVTAPFTVRLCPWPETSAGLPSMSGQSAQADGSGAAPRA
jgi:hypothetical protein